MSRIAAHERLSRAAPIWLPALAASGFLAVFDPLPRGDALATTLPILPLVVAALVAIGRRVGDRTPRETAIVEGAALGIVLLLALSRGSLGIAFPAALPAAGLALLLGQRVVRLVPALLLVLGLTAVRRLEAGAERRRTWAAVLACALLLPLLKLRFALLGGPLLVLAWWRSGRSRKVLVAVAGLSIGGLLALMAFNQVVFGNPLKMHNWQAITGLYQRPLSSYWRGACGLLLDPAFGLAGCAPVWLLLLPAGVLHFGRRSRLLGDVLALNAIYLVVLMPRQAWYGEWSPPFRYGLVMLPLLALFLVPLLDRRAPTVGRALTGLLVTLTLTLGLLWVVEPNWTYNFGDGRTLLFDAVSHRTGSDLVRFFPSYVRPRAASWIWPLVCLLALPLYWLGRRRAGRAATCGAALALLAAAAVVVAAETLPTRVVEIEDPWVAKRGGELYPERWARSRVSYDPGWILAPGDAASATVNPGGESVRLVLEVGRRAPARPLRIRVQADGVEIAAWTLAQPHRETLTAGPVAWPRGARRLSLTVERSDPTDSGSVVNLDRLRLRWGGPIGPGTARTEHGSHRHLEPSFRVGLVDLAQDSRHVEA